MRKYAMLALAWTGVCAAAAQEVYPLEQQREVEVRAACFGNENVQFGAAADFESWLADLAAEECDGGVATSALHLSTIAGERIELMGYAQTRVSAGYGWPLGSARHACRVRFAVPERVAYQLSGALDLETSIDAWPYWNASATQALRLRRLSGAELYGATPEIVVSDWQPPEEWSQWVYTPLAGAGVLEAGVYELALAAQLEFGGGENLYFNDPPPTVELAYVVILTVSAPLPPPACVDLDGDGDFDLLDMAVLQECLTGPQ